MCCQGQVWDILVPDVTKRLRTWEKVNVLHAWRKKIKHYVISELFFGARTILESGLSITTLIYAINSPKISCVHTFTLDLLNAVVIIVLTA